MNQLNGLGDSVKLREADELRLLQAINSSTPEFPLGPYLERALENLRIEGRRIEPEDVARFSPLQHKNLNFLGRYQFSLPAPVFRGEYRPLRQPENLECLNR